MVRKLFNLVVASMQVRCNICNNMVARNATKGKKKRQRFAGISADSRALKVNRSHLWRVLSGQRQSRSLMLRYDALKTRQASAARPDARGAEGENIPGSPFLR